MMQFEFMPYLSPILNQQAAMTSLLQEWIGINSGTENIDGLQKMFVALQHKFSTLNCYIQTIALPPRQKVDALGCLIEIPVGNALVISQRPELKRRVFLGGHMDTVYAANSSFQNFEMLSANKMRGPGTADMKGGLVVMLKALEAFENSPWASSIGWNLVINPDEEVGSVSSEKLIIDMAKDCQMGLIFEPSFSDGYLVSARKGSANYSLVAKGKAAHAGRDFHQGRNAIMALARLAVIIDARNYPSSGTTMNIGSIHGGDAINVVPDFAICKLNIRSDSREEQSNVEKWLKELVAEANIDGIEIQLLQETFRSPKPFDIKTEEIFEKLKSCAKQLSMDYAWRPSGGVCDGNVLALARVPCIDTMGAIGGGLHTHEEYVELDSLPKKAAIAALMLMNFSYPYQYLYPQV